MNNFVNVNVMKIHENASLPKQGSVLSAGSDLYSVENYTLLPLTRRLISTGIKMQFPSNVYGRIAPRSGLAFKNGIDVMAGVIDPDYTGEIKVLLYNNSNEPFEIKSGERIAQIVFESFKQPLFNEVIQIQETERSNGGFGSTGVN